MGLSTSLNTAIAGLSATQVGIGVVSQNVANADKAGYIRRQVSTSDTIAGSTISTSSGNVQRLLDQVVQRQLWQETSSAAYTATRADILSGVDQLYGTPGSSTALDAVYSKFTSSLQALKNDPSSYSLRASVIDTATQLAGRLNALSDGVQALRTQAEAGIANAVTQTNALLNSLTSVNARIVGSPDSAGTAELKDQRDRIVAELAQYIDIKSTEDARGSLSIVTGSGAQIFDGRPAVTFSFDERSALGPESQWSADPAQRSVGTLTMTDMSGNRSDAIANRTFRSGEIAAYVELRDKTLNLAQAQLDEIAAQLSGALSDTETTGVVTGTGAANSVTLNADIGALSRGNTITFDYKATPGGATQRLTFVNASSGTVLPASAQGDANNRVVPVDLSGGPAAVAAAIQSAIESVLGAPSGFSVTNPSGNQLQIDAGATRQVAGLTAYATNTVLAAPIVPPATSVPVELPFFVDAGRSNGAFTGSYENGSQVLGYASRIAVNQGLVSNQFSQLVVYNTTLNASTGQGDSTRPALILDRLTNSQRNITRATGFDGQSSASTATVSQFVQRIVSSQGQAVETAKRLDEGQQIALAAVQSRFQESAQVNIDQEMSTLIELQSAYAANARIISTVKEMMDVLMRI